MGLIRVLSDIAINQISAGEVVETPASVVKELIENSLDSGATQIWIEISGAGFQLIQVADNGCGMNQDDAILCFERHATSKITSIEDLSALKSMGFRGEALASIAAVAHVELITAQASGTGTRVDISGGKIQSVKTCSRSVGTTISVRSLFYNVPARKKFQKSISATTAEIYRCILSLALCNPHIGFELTVADAVTLSTTMSREKAFILQLEERIDQLFDDAFLQNKRVISAQKDGYQLQGFLGSPVDDRVNKTGQYLYVNQRLVYCPMISEAVKEGYGHRIDTRRHPIFVLHLQAPEGKIDVNVHPQKHQVKFAEESLVYQLIQNSVHTALQGHSQVKELASHGSNSTYQQILPPVPETATFSASPLQFREESSQANYGFIQEPEVIGLFTIYLLLDGRSLESKQEGMVFVHLQKAHEYLLRQEFFETPVNDRSQGLFIPLPLPINRQEKDLLEEKMPFLVDIGFSIDQSGSDSYFIQAIPSFIQEKQAVELIHFLLSKPLGYQLLTQFICKKKTHFTLQEALALWHKVKGLNDPEIITVVGVHAIERFFK